MSDTPQGPGWWQASDGKFYPPQPQTQPPPPPMGVGPTGPLGGPMPPPAQSGMSGCLKAFLIVGGLCLILGFGACVAVAFVIEDAADDVADDLDFNDAEEARDVGDPDCRVNDAGFMEAEVTVTNNSSERSNYLIEITFEDDDGAQLDTTRFGPGGLEPGQSTDHVSETLTEPPPDGSFTCRVRGVNRFSAERGG